MTQKIDVYVEYVGKLVEYLDTHGKAVKNLDVPLAHRLKELLPARVATHNIRGRT